MFRSGFCIGFAFWIGSCAIASAQPKMSATRIASFSPNIYPIFATTAPGDPDRLFVVSQGEGESNGIASIWIVNLITGKNNQQPFLTVSGVACCNSRGLLGMAFHPDYKINGLFYINFTALGGVNTPITTIREYTRQTADLADPASARTLMTIPQPAINHNGGWMGFGPNDGHLYIASGDGGFGLSSINAQNKDNLLGKILRINPLGSNSANGKYGIPVGNPFVDGDGEDEIWAYGLRNPWRASFDRQTSDLYIGDVGQSSREEINVQPANSTGGENYGWDVREGTLGSLLSGAIDPIYQFSHNASGGNAVIGGYVYRGPIAALQGHYFFSDYQTHRIRSMKWNGGDPTQNDATNFTDFIDWTDFISVDAGNNRFISSFGEDSVGNLLIVNRGGNGDIYRVDSASIPDGGVVTPNSVATTRGGYTSGDPSSLANSDDVDYQLHRLSADLQSRTEFEVKGISPTVTPTGFAFTLEGSVFARGNVVQTIELFDYVAGDWELVDTANAARSPTPDSIVTATPAGDLSRFVEAETMSIETRIRYQSDRARQNFASNTDQAIWTIGQ